MAFDIAANGYSPTYVSYMDWSNVLDLSGYLRLHDDGCNYDGVTNCTRACQDPDKLWNDSWRSILTLSNCIIYPAIAQLLSHDNLTAAAVLTAERFGIRNDTESPLFDDWPGIRTCIDSFCEDSASTEELRGCRPPTSQLNYSTYFYADSRSYRDVFHLNLDFNTQMCTGVTTRDLGINLDLGGIGMLVSYISQVSAVLAICLLWHGLHDWARLFFWISLKVRRKHENARSAARDLQQKIIDSDFYASMVKLLAEFQKAQVFFICAVEVAALIALCDPTKLADDGRNNTNADTFKASSDLLDNIDVFLNLAFASTLSVVLSLLVLRLAGKKDSYTIAITTCPVVLAPALWGLARSKLGNDTFRNIEADEGPTQCAGVKPTAFCYPLARVTASPFTGNASVGLLSFCVIVHACIVWEHLAQLRLQAARARATADRSAQDVRWKIFAGIPAAYAGLTGSVRDSRHATRPAQDTLALLPDQPHQQPAGRLAKTASNIAGLWGRWPRRLLWTTIYAAELTLFIFNGLLLAGYIAMIHPGQGWQAEDFQKWTLGQVIAVTIWFPVLFEFLWDLYRGIAKNIEERLLPATYRVVKVEPIATTGARDGPPSGTELSSLPAMGPYEPLPDSAP